MYNIGFWSFQSFNVKFELILNLSKSKKCPLLISNSKFKNYAEFKKVQNMKVVDLEKLNNFCIWRFSSFNTNLKVILKIQKRAEPSFVGKQATCLLTADELRPPSRHALVATSCFDVAKQAAVHCSPIHPSRYKARSCRCCSLFSLYSPLTTSLRRQNWSLLFHHFLLALVHSSALLPCTH
jgi:hypothetical protein